MALQSPERYRLTAYEQALDLVAFLIEIGVVVALNAAISFGWDYDFSSAFCHLFNKMVGIITFVGQKSVGINVLDKLVGEGDVVALPGRRDQSDWKPESFASGVDFGAQPASRPTQALRIRPPFSRRAPAARW